MKAISRFQVKKTLHFAISVFCVIVIVVSCASIIYPVYDDVVSSRYYKKQAANLVNSVSLGESKESVLKKLATKENAFFDIREKSGDCLFCRIPHPIIGQNWSLYFVFSDSKLIAALIRVEGSETERPKNAPNDKQIPNSKVEICLP